MERVTAAFVLSAPRSGSTWLMRALSAHPEVHATEHRFFGPHHDEVIDHGSDRPRLRITLDRFADAHARHLNLEGLGLDVAGAREAVLRALADRLLDLDRTLTGKPVIVDKVTPYPGTAPNVAERLARLFPGSPVVALVRDGRDVLTSGVHHWLTKRLAGDPERPEPRLAWARSGAAPAFDRFFADGEIEEWASLWRECVRASRGAPLEVRYERMAKDLASELGEVFTLLGVGSDAGVLGACVRAGSFERASGGRAVGQHDPGAHARSGVAGDWRRLFTRRDGESFDAIAGEELVELGYDREGWWRGLPGTLRRSA